MKINQKKIKLIIKKINKVIQSNKTNKTNKLNKTKKRKIKLLNGMDMSRVIILNVRELLKIMKLNLNLKKEIQSIWIQ